MGFSYQEHTADVIVHAQGLDFAGALSEACRALTNLLVPVERVQTKLQERFSLTIRSREQVAFDVLSHVLYLLDTKHFIPAAAVCVFNGDSVAITLTGDTIRNYESSGDLKAITYHALAVTEDETGVTLSFSVDI